MKWYAPLAIVLVAGCQPPNPTPITGPQAKSTRENPPSPPPSGSAPIEPIANAPETPVGAPSAMSPTPSDATPPMPTSGPGSTSASTPARPRTSPTPSSRPATSRYQIPERKADEVASGFSYGPAGDNIEVVGVCKIGEDAVSCWKPDGSADQDLEAKVRAAMEKSYGQEDYGRGFSVQYGKKNRVIVVKTTQTSFYSSGGRPSASLHLSGVGTSMNASTSYGGHIDLNLNESNSYPGNRPYIRYEARMVAGGKTETATSAWLTSTAPAGSGDIECRAGAKTTIEGTSFAIKSVGPLTDEDELRRVSTMRKGKWWKVVYEIPGGLRQSVGCYVHYQGEGGRLAYVDNDGRPVSQETVSKEQNEMQEKWQKAMREGKSFTGIERAPRYTSVRTDYSSSSGRSGLSLLINMNPEHVKTLKIVMTKHRTIEIKNIPLDPR